MAKSINAFVFASIVVAAYLQGSVANATDITGTVDNVVDGDTFDICTDQFCPRIRICGIDAPERSEAGGDAATAYLKSIILGKVVRCRPVGQGTVCDGRSKSAEGSELPFAANVTDVGFWSFVDISLLLPSAGAGGKW